MTDKRFKTKKGNGTLNIQVSTPITDRPIVSCPETQNNLRTNKTTSHKKINSSNSYSQVQEHTSFSKPKKCYTRTLKL